MGFFGRVPCAVLASSLSAGAKSLYAHLTIYGLNLAGVGLSMGELANAAGVSRRTVIRYVNELDAHGFLDRRAHKGQRHGVRIALKRENASTGLSDGFGWGDTLADHSAYENLTASRRGSLKHSKSGFMRPVRRRVTKMSHVEHVADCLETPVSKPFYDNLDSATCDKSVTRRTKITLGEKEAKSEDSSVFSAKPSCSIKSKEKRKPPYPPAGGESLAAPKSKPKTETRDWRDMAIVLPAKVKGAKKAPPVSRVRSESKGSVATERELETTPRSEWAWRHLMAHYQRRVCEADPTLARLRTEALLPPRQRVHMRDLLDLLTDPAWHPDDAVSKGIQQVAGFIDHVFDNHERLTKVLRIRGSLTPAVLWGFRDPLLSDWRGTVSLGRSKAAARDTGADGSAASVGLISSSRRL